jgi:hypothetical protein
MAIGHNLRKMAAKAVFSSYFDLLLQFIVSKNNFMELCSLNLAQNNLVYSMAKQNETKFCFVA